MGGGERSVNVGPKVITGTQAQDAITITFDHEDEDVLHFTMTKVGDFRLTRAAFCDQTTLSESNPLNFGEVAFMSRVLAGYGVKNDGTVCIRINMLELLRDVLIELISENGAWRVRLTDVHLPHKPELLFDTKNA